MLRYLESLFGLMKEEFDTFSITTFGDLRSGIVLSNTKEYSFFYLVLIIKN